MITDDDVLAFLEEGDKELIEQMEEKRTPVLFSKRYSYMLDAAEREALDKREWTILEGTIYKRGGEDVDCDDDKVWFTVELEHQDRVLADVMVAINEHLDQITGRHLEKANGDAWGMF